MSVERDLMIRSLRRQIDLERKAKLRRPFVSARRAESGIDHSQLAKVAAVNLRVTEEGNGATSGDIGKFWFTAGYSVLGGPDIVPEN